MKTLQTIHHAMAASTTRSCSGIRDKSFSIGLLLSLFFGLTMPAQAIVYTLSNEIEENRVLAFDINERTNRINEIGSFSTGGTGTGAPIGNQSALTTDDSD